jgi:hypothetical protein
VAYCHDPEGKLPTSHFHIEKKNRFGKNINELFKKYKN